MHLLHQLTGIYTVIFAVTTSMTAAQSPSPRASYGHAIDPQLSLVMKANAHISQATELKETWAWLEHLSSKPACTQLATSKLAIECQHLDNPSEFAKTYPYQVLEDVQNEFALKLAICEYVGAQSPYSTKAPHKCHAFLPSHGACVKRSWWGKVEAVTDELCYPKATKADLQQCLTTMQASPQSWTSYSNARSRAMHICHLTRQHIETERAIQVHKNLTLVVAKMHDSVQPLASKMQSMNDQLHAFSDHSRRSFEQSQQAVDDFTKFAKDAHTQYHDQLKGTNEGLRNMRSGLEASHQKIDDHYTTLQSRLDHHLETSLARSNEVMAQHRDDYMAQLATAFDIFIQEKAMELSNMLKTHNEELQEYHTKNMLAVVQHHETAVKSFDILKTGISSASFDVDGINDKIGTLKNELDGFIVQVEIVNAGLGSLASVAQAAGRLLVSFETFITFCSIGGILIGLLLFTKCVSNVPILGNAARTLITMTMALLVCGTSAYVLSRLLCTYFEVDTLVEAFQEAAVSERNLLRIKGIACITLLTCAFLSLFRYVSDGMKRPFSTASIHKILYCQRVAPQTQILPPTNSASPTTPLFSGDMAIGTFNPAQSTTPAHINNLSLSKEAQKDEVLRDRIMNFRRASTVI